MKRAAFLILLSIIFTNNLFAQNVGYVINLKGDTLKCEVKTTLFGGVRYVVNGDTKKIKNNDIQEFQITADSTIFRAEVLRDGAKPEFVQLIERGKICLYEEISTSGNGTQITDWYISKDNKPLIILKSSGLLLFGGNHGDRKSALGDMFSDNPQIAAAYNAEDSFSFKNIRKYVQQYNEAAKNQSAIK